LGRFDLFAKPSANGGYLRIAVVIISANESGEEGGCRPYESQLELENSN
jgi:hypothetical protein